MTDLSPLSPRTVAEQCRGHAKLATTHNLTAIVLMLAAKMLEQTLDRNVRLARLLELTEASL